MDALIEEPKTIAEINYFERNNLMASLQKYPTEAEYINSVLNLFQSFNKSFDKTVDHEEIPSIQMFWLVFRGFNISTQLALQGHFSESYAIISRSAEATGYARKFQTDTGLLDIWFKKKEFTLSEFKSKFGEPFPENDNLLHPKVWDIYNLTRDYGTHSNFETTVFFTDASKLDTDNQVFFEYSDFTDEINTQRTINYIIYCHFEFLKVFRELFKLKLNQIWISELDRVITQYDEYKNTLRKIFVPDIPDIVHNK